MGVGEEEHRTLCWEVGREGRGQGEPLTSQSPPQSSRGLPSSASTLVPSFLLANDGDRFRLRVEVEAKVTSDTKPSSPVQSLVQVAIKKGKDTFRYGERRVQKGSITLKME